LTCFPLGDFTLFFEATVFIANTPQDPVKTARMAAIIAQTIFVLNDVCLHPNAWRLFFI
jgi:hypothetical protein